MIFSLIGGPSYQAASTFALMTMTQHQEPPTTQQPEEMAGGWLVDSRTGVETLQQDQLSAAAEAAAALRRKAIIRTKLG